MRGSICSCHQTPQMPRSHSFSTWPVWSAPRIMGTLCLIKYHDSDTYHHSALRRETFFAPLQKKESLSSSLILLRVAQASRAKIVSLLSAEWWYVSESWYLIRQSVPIILGADQTGQVEKEWDLGICGV